MRVLPEELGRPKLIIYTTKVGFACFYNRDLSGAIQFFLE
jgi:hypothetical protein